MSMTEEDLRKIVVDVIGHRDAEIARDMTANDVGGWDSLHHTLIMLEISAAYDVEIGAEETANLMNLGELIDLVNARIAAKG